MNFDFEVSINLHRLELAVVTFSRTIDWHGFFGYWGLYRQRYSTIERRWLGWRLGAANAWFDHCMAVDYYHLDMANPEERIVVEELVRSCLYLIVSVLLDRTSE